MALFVDFDRLLLFPDTVSDLARQVDVPDRQKPCIDIVVDGLFIQHNVICIVDTNVVNGMALLNQRCDDAIDTLQFIGCNSESLTAFAADRLILLLCILGIVEMPLQLTALTLFTSVTNIGRFLLLRTHLFLIIRAVCVAGRTALETILFPLLLARMAEISIMFSGKPMDTGVKSIFLNYLVVTTNFFRDCRWIFAQQFADFLKGEMISQGYFNRYSFIKGEMRVLAIVINSFRGT